MRVIQKIDAVHQTVLSICNSIGSALIFMLMVLIVWDVLGRVLFNIPLKGTPELVANSIIIITFLQIPFVLYKKRHIRSTMIYDQLPVATRHGIDIAVSVVGIVLFSLLITSSWGKFVVSISIGEFEGEGALRVPAAPGRFALIFGSALMILEFAFFIVRVLTGTDAIAEQENLEEGGLS